ncbi:hypothetical protein HPO96_36960 [Kribbella sandramycini]|uniref:P22 coat protein Gp5 n=1 Tax=Kribbella sandramycini TaxID=60450 RepID=A0A7Y4L7J4_9ACTN|nr:P22 phage major capsid protein family protein [Kribbella sandramycini]MBB6564387.1 hypothetical protein [Kribbella sandramycini]NOL45850.1 hypothetical protein [Kribbella sandramycini]
MANTLYTAPDVVKLATALLTQDLVLAQTINRDYEDNYDGGKGTTVNVRVPAALKARRRDLTNSGTTGQLAAFVVDSLAETTFPIALSGNPYSKVALNQREMTFDLENFGEQVLAPQVDALGEDIESLVAETMIALPEATTFAYSATDPTKLFTAVRKALRDNGVPVTGLRAAVGTKVWQDMADAKVFSASTQASNPLVPGQENVGGFACFETNRIDDEQVVFYHRDSFTLAVRAPEAPTGDEVYAASLSTGGFSLQHIRDYDSSIGQHTSLVQTFTGCSYQQFRNIDRSGSTASIVLVPSAYRVDTATDPA